MYKEYDNMIHDHLSDEELVVATTRPETMLGDTGVAVHPEDSRSGLKLQKYLETEMSNLLNI